jgi:hypothetical protein
MSVYVTLKVTCDPAAFERSAAEQADAIGRVMEIAKSKGLIGHRWLRGEGVVMAVDEWPDAASFEGFYGSAEGDIGPIMAGAGVTTPPEVTVWGQVAIDDVFGWGA